MPFLSVNELHKLTGKTRATVTKALDGMEAKPGPKKANLYDSKLALAKLYGATGESGATFITAQEAQRLLTIKRGEQIDLEMEVTRKERIPLSVIEAINNEVLSNVAGMWKAHEGKPLTAQLIRDMMTEARRMGESMKA